MEKLIWFLDWADILALIGLLLISLVFYWVGQIRVQFFCMNTLYLVAALVYNYERIRDGLS